MILLNNIQVVGGEEKASCSQMNAAKEELRSKYKGANAVLYGSLGYVLLIATAGTDYQIYAMHVEKGTSLHPVTEKCGVRLAWMHTLNGSSRALACRRDAAKSRLVRAACTMLVQA